MIILNNIDSGRLDKGFLCKNMTAQVSSILILGDYIDTNLWIEISKRYPKTIYGEKFLQDWQEVSKLREAKVKDNIFGLYIPSRAFKDSQGDIYVEYWSLHRKAKLSTSAGVFWQEVQRNQFLFWGDVKALLPIMPLFRNIKEVELGKKTFQKFLDIICTFTHLLTQDNIKEYSLEDFFAGFFLLFYSIPLEFFTKNTIEALIDIRFNLKKDSAYFNHMMYTVDIWLNLDFEIQNFFWEYVKEIYSQDYKHYLKYVNISKLLQIVKHLAASKRGPCWNKHKEIKDPRSARKSVKHLPVTNLSEYIQPILRIIKCILSEWSKASKDSEITYGIVELVSILWYKQTPCYRIEILKVIQELVSEQEPCSYQFKNLLKDEKVYFLILKTFNDSYYDVQTHCALIIKYLDLSQSIKEKIFSFMNYTVWPPDQRDIDVSLEDMTAYHSPVFKNQVRNILEHSEELKSQSQVRRQKKEEYEEIKKTRDDSEHEMKQLKIALRDEPDMLNSRSSKHSI